MGLDGFNLIRDSLLSLVLGALNELALVEEWLSLLVWDELIGELNISLLISKLSDLSLLEVSSPLLVLSHSFSGGSSHVWLWHIEVNIVLVIVVIILNLDIGSLTSLNRSKVLILKEVISVIFMIELNVLVVRMSLVVMFLLNSSTLLSIVAFEILVEESIIITLWGELSVMEWLVIVSNSWKILWSINNVWVISGLKILIFSTVESLRWVIKIEPVGTLSSLLIEWVLLSSSLLSHHRSSISLDLLVSMVLKDLGG